MDYTIENSMKNTKHLRINLRKHVRLVDRKQKHFLREIKGDKIIEEIRHINALEVSIF